MPPLPVLADVYRVTFNWTTAGGQTAKNVMHWKDTAGTHVPADLAAALTANITGDLLDSMGAASCGTVDILPLDGVSATTTHAISGWGGSGSSVLTIPSGACLIKLQTGLRGPSKRGRIFLPFTSEASQDDGFLGASARTNIQNAWNAFLTAMAADDFILGVASYVHSTFYSAVTVSVESALGTQKRRQDRNRR